MTVPPCILTLMIVYPPLLAAGWWAFRYFHKANPRPFPEGDMRNRTVGIFRFLLFVALFPLGILLAAGLMGWLDPLFWLIRDGLY